MNGASGSEIAWAAAEGAALGALGGTLGVGLAARAATPYIAPVVTNTTRTTATTTSAAAAGRATSPVVTAAASAAGRRCNSFTPGTQVVMADGSHKAIEEVTDGELVLATDVLTGATGAAEVSASTVTPTTERNLVTVGTESTGEGNAGSEITATAGHAFWAAAPDSEPWNGDLAGWVPASNLEVGNWLRASAGTWIQVTAVKPRVQNSEARNLAIADQHTYYVVINGTPVLVHNCGIEYLPRIAGRATGIRAWRSCCAPARVRRQPETFCRSLTIRISRSAA